MISCNCFNFTFESFPSSLILFNLLISLRYVRKTQVIEMRIEGIEKNIGIHFFLIFTQVNLFIYSLW
ncbi:Hypothetical protein I595_1557 [Croceitalea dokdonensis DOKDO 023]|uniref:Uncharacterized protein n=1 Tax=Croceitalea dokdonensis DOKDO 023 TaxID=1300341 RepID=A0A0P7A5Q1_9FLAO|nr:Hypothetical protein I595_1557 [Croceitalea dokdonensis DOKDO 023]